MVGPSECQIVDVVLVHEDGFRRRSNSTLNDFLLIQEWEDIGEVFRDLSVDHRLGSINWIEGCVDQNRLGNILVNDGHRRLLQIVISVSNIPY